tara:strand:+ start:414 stop:881 length:468 start_codon:yes stop_codon:yes gene_type:complete
MATRSDFDADETMATLSKGISNGLNKITLSLQKRIRKKLSKPGSGKMYGKHQASAPGEPPANKSGNLINSWTSAKIRGPIKTKGSLKAAMGPANIGGSAKYAWALEYGHEFSNRTLLPRPYVKPSILMLEKGNRAGRIMQNQLDRAIKEANRRVD